MKSGRKTNDQEMEWRKKDEKEAKKLKGKKNKWERNWIMIKWYVEEIETELKC